MRILMSVTYYAPYVSGLTIWVSRMARGLIDSGHRVDVLCMKHESALPNKEDREGVTVTRANILMRLSKGMLSIDWIIQSWIAVMHCDVLIVNLPQFEGFIPALFARLCGKKVIVEYHCEVILPGGLVNYMIQKALETANNFTLMLADNISTYTDDYAVSSKLLKPFLSKVTAIFPPIPKPIIDNNLQDQLRKKAGIQNGEYIIGVAARLSAEKGIEYLLEALLRLKKTLHGKTIKLLIAGPLNPVGEEQYKEKIFSLVKSLGDSVIFLGTLSQQEMGSFYSLLDVLVLPSINATEAFGMVQVEAMMCGVPVIASDLPGVRVPVRMTGMGLVVPIKSSYALVNELQDVEHYRRNTGSFRLIQKLFSVDKTITDYNKLFV